MTKRIYIYRLTDAQGNITFTVQDDCQNSGTIGGYDKDDKYHQFDSYELFHAYDWAKERGFVLESATFVLEIPNGIFDCKGFERIFDVKMTVLCGK